MGKRPEPSSVTSCGLVTCLTCVTTLPCPHPFRALAVLFSLNLLLPSSSEPRKALPAMATWLPPLLHPFEFQCPLLREAFSVNLFKITAPSPRPLHLSSCFLWSTYRFSPCGGLCVFFAALAANLDTSPPFPGQGFLSPFVQFCIPSA